MTEKKTGLNSEIIMFIFERWTTEYPHEQNVFTELRKLDHIFHLPHKNTQKFGSNGYLTFVNYNIIIRFLQ